MVQKKEVSMEDHKLLCLACRSFFLATESIVFDEVLEMECPFCGEKTIVSPRDIIAISGILGLELRKHNLKAGNRLS